MFFMNEKYIPHYAKGQIVVSFGNEISWDFVRDFGKKIGYKFLEIKPSPDYYLFEVEGGKEKKAMQEFLKHDKFVEGVELRDLKIEKRFQFKDDLERIVNDLDECLPKEQFVKKLDKIKNYIEKFDDEKFN